MHSKTITIDFNPDSLMYHHVAVGQTLIKNREVTYTIIEVNFDNNTLLLLEE